MTERLLSVDEKPRRANVVRHLRVNGRSAGATTVDADADAIAAELDRLYAAAEANQAPGPDWKAKLREEVEALGMPPQAVGPAVDAWDHAVSSALDLIDALPDPPTPDPDAPPVYVLEPGHYGPVLGKDVRDGWEGRPSPDATWGAAEDCRRVYPRAWFEVRRVPAPEPATEWVPLTKLVGRTIKGETKAVAVAVASSAGGKWVWCNGIDGLFAPFPTRDDGMVEVLAEGER